MGTDMLELERFAHILARHEGRFVRRVFTAAEIARADSHPTPHRRMASFAKRFAAKEACAKALGTGFRNGLFLRDIEVVNDTLGRPSLVLHGMAQQLADALMPPGYSPMLHLSLSDSETLAWATVILEGRDL